MATTKVQDLTSLGTLDIGDWVVAERVVGTTKKAQYNATLATGGTGAALTASNGGMIYSTATTMAVLAGTATAGLPLISGSSAAPTWGTLNGTGNLVATTSASLTTPALGTPTSGVLSSCTGYPTASLTGLGTGVATFLATPSSANLASALTDETGSGAAVFATTPTLVAPVINDASGNALLRYVTTASAVNYVEVKNQATGDGPELSAKGTDANIGIVLNTKGTGQLILNSANTTVPLTIYSGTGLQHSSSFSMADTNTTRTYTLPDVSGTVALKDLANGGTNGALTASNGGIVYSTASAMEILAGTATAGLPLISGSSAAPTWGTLNGTGNLVATTSPSLTTPALGTVSSGNISACTSTSMVMVTPVLGTPTSGALSNCTAYPQSALTGLGTGVSTFLGTPSSANLLAALTDETGTGAAVFGTSPTITTPNIVGTSAANNASAGSVGEFTSATLTSGSATALTTDTPTNVTSISLTAGDWDVWVNLGFSGGATTDVGYLQGWSSETSATQPALDLLTCLPFVGSAVLFSEANVVLAGQTKRYSLASTTTIYASVQAGFSVSTCSAYGNIQARRRR